MPKIKTVAIATPTYNEAKNIQKLITTLSKVCGGLAPIKFTIWVIDDNSPDGTADVADKAGRDNKVKNVTVHVMRRKAKNGLGQAYIDAFNELLKKDFDFVMQMDADMSHHPKYIPQFVSLAESGHDFIVASRYLKGGGTPDWKWYRKLLSRGGNLYTRLFLGSTITDYTGGYNMFSKQLLKKIDVNSLGATGYGFLIELKFRAIQNAISPAQVPIVFHDRQHGNSKIPKRTLVKNFVLVVQLKLQGPHKS